jgi:16S rRNA (guanine1207-N2)-methyltransferase
VIDARLSLALDGGGLVLPTQAPVVVVSPPQEAEFPGVARETLRIIDGFKPFHDLWLARGFDAAVTLDARCAAAIVCLPRSKADARAMIAAAVEQSDGVIVVDGQKTDGVDSLLRDIKKRVAVTGPISKAHGKLFWFTPQGDNFADWRAGPSLTQGGFWTAPGVFSADAVDPASALLADALPASLGKSVVDLGAGWGALSAHILTRQDVAEVHLVEAHHMALECARRNVTDPRAQFHWADALNWQPEKKVDTVVMNPPFHTGRAAEPDLGKAFVAAAARCLNTGGQLWMVANRHLPYEATLNAHFAKVSEIIADPRFKIFNASRPKRLRS